MRFVCVPSLISPQIYRMCFSPDARFLAVVGHDEVAVYQPSTQWDLRRAQWSCVHHQPAPFVRQRARFAT